MDKSKTEKSITLGGLHLLVHLVNNGREVTNQCSNLIRALKITINGNYLCTSLVARVVPGRYHPVFGIASENANGWRTFIALSAPKTSLLRAL